LEWLTWECPVCNDRLKSKWKKQLEYNIIHHQFKHKSDEQIKKLERSLAGEVEPYSILEESKPK